LVFGVSIKRPYIVANKLFYLERRGVGIVGRWGVDNFLT